jgi:phosphoribosyl-AMP cyclohydrolase
MKKLFSLIVIVFFTIQNGLCQSSLIDKSWIMSVDSCPFEDILAIEEEYSFYEILMQDYIELKEFDSSQESFIEFYFSSKTNNLHISCNESGGVENYNDTIKVINIVSFVEVDYKFKYKESNKTLLIYFPEKGKYKVQIIADNKLKLIKL